MLLHVPGVLDDASLSRIRATLEGAAWTDGRETVGPQGAGVKRNLQLPDGSPVRNELGQIVTAALGRLQPILGKDRTTLGAIKTTMFASVTEALGRGPGGVSL